jgi:exodeoxyribonuclease V alpha subunit
VRFRHDARNRLPHDLVVVDEVSMVSLSLMARLLEAVRPDARVVLVGDHEQLASVEAGSVLGDIVGPAGAAMRLSGRRRAVLGTVGAMSGQPVTPAGSAAGPAGGPAAGDPAPDDAAGDPAAGDPAPDDTPSDRAAGEAAHEPASIGDCVVVLRRVHRFGGSIAELAATIQRAEPDEATAVLERGAEDVDWLACDPDSASEEQLAPARELAVLAGRAVFAAAQAGEAAEALAGIGRFRLLCANRRGPYGVETWQQVVEAWLSSGVRGFAEAQVWAAGSWFYAGLPLIVTVNDYDLQLFNGDSGVVVAGENGRLSAVFESAGASTRYPLDRLALVERCFASTVHKSQGSQFDAVAVVLPDAASPILTRELLYTAVTRARRRVVVVGTPAAVRAAVERPIARASGLRRRLWGESGPAAGGHGL